MFNPVTATNDMINIKINTNENINMNINDNININDKLNTKFSKFRFRCRRCSSNKSNFRICYVRTHKRGVKTISYKTNSCKWVVSESNQLIDTRIK